MREFREVCNSRPAPCARALSCLLLSLIIFGATFGVVHHHGIAPPKLAAFAGDRVGATDPVTDPINGGTQSKDCSICQLHRNLGVGLHVAPVFQPAATAQYAPPLANPVFYFSASATPQRGRAPPQTSLT